MKIHQDLLLGVLVSLIVASNAYPLTVENLSIEKMTKDSPLIVYGRVQSSYSQWEGRNIYTYTTVQVKEVLKGQQTNVITVKQLGGQVRDTALEVSGSPNLARNEEVVLFLTQWRGSYWIHSIVLGKFSVIQQDGGRVAFNNLNNIGLIDPVTKREVTEPNRKSNHFPLQQFLSEIRSFVQK